MRDSLELLAVAAAWTLVLAACEGPLDEPSDNSPPEAVIDRPISDYYRLELVDGWLGFEGRVQDDTTPAEELLVVWTSDQDGELFSGRPDSEGRTVFEAQLDLGSEGYCAHDITLQVWDAQGAHGEAQVFIDAEEYYNPAPWVHIQSPTADGEYYSNIPVLLHADADDFHETPGDLRVSWALESGEVLAEDLALDSHGEVETSVDFPSGTHTLLATVTDSGGATGTDTVTFEVLPE